MLIFWSTTSYRELAKATESYRKLPKAAAMSSCFGTPECAEGSPRARQNLASPAKIAEQTASISSRRSAAAALSPSPYKESAVNRKAPPSS